MWFIAVEGEQETSAPPPKKNPGSAPEHLTAELVACVAWRFWLGAVSNKGGRGQRSRSFSRALRANFAARGFAARAPGSTKPPCYAGYRAGGRALDSPGRTNT